jgi:hypothetical protein
VEGVLGGPPLPHPLSGAEPPTLNVSSNSILKGRRLFKPKQQSTTASIDPENHGAVLWRRVAVVVEALTVSVEASAPDRVVMRGEKLHDAPEGNPEQVNETDALNPFAGVTETVAVPLCPPVIVIEAGEISTEKSGGGTFRSRWPHPSRELDR